MFESRDSVEILALKLAHGYVKRQMCNCCSLPGFLSSTGIMSPLSLVLKSPEVRVMNLLMHSLRLHELNGRDRRFNYNMLFSDGDVSRTLRTLEEGHV